MAQQQPKSVMGKTGAAPLQAKASPSPPEEQAHAIAKSAPVRPAVAAPPKAAAQNVAQPKARFLVTKSSLRLPPTRWSSNQAVAKDGRRFCYFFNHGGCNREGCNFSHDTPPRAVKEGMTEPPSRSKSPGGRRPDPKAKAKAKPRAKSTPRGKAAPAAPPPPAAPAPRAPREKSTGPSKFGGMKKLWCPFFIKGTCNKGDNCPMPHVNEDAKKALQAAVQNAAGASK